MEAILLFYVFCAFMAILLFALFVVMMIDVIEINKTLKRIEEDLKSNDIKKIFQSIEQILKFQVFHEKTGDSGIIVNRVNTVNSIYSGRRLRTMDRVRMIGLWKREDEKGNAYLSDKPDGTSSVVVIPNTFKKESGDPDYFLYRKPDKEEQSGEKSGENEFFTQPY